MALDEETFTPPAGSAQAGVRSVGKRDALLLIRHVTDHPEISVVGDLDPPAASRLREAVELAVENEPVSVTIDGRGIGRVGIAGLNALADAVALCRERGIKLDLTLSASARSLLDSVGLWWLGVIDRGPALDVAIRDARVAYGQLIGGTGRSRGSQPVVSLE